MPRARSRSLKTSSSTVRATTKWKVDFEKTCLLGCFHRRGWERCFDREETADGRVAQQESKRNPDDLASPVVTTVYNHDWHVYWANVANAKQLFSPDFPFRLRDDQLVNHFPNYYELTRKDLLVKNMKRYRKDLLQQQSLHNKHNDLGKPGGPANVQIPCDFLPPTYVLPVDYSLFLEEFRKNSNSMWIMKPSSKARGIGIFLVSKLSQIKRWASRNTSDVYVISKYIERPLLIGGRKFDLRLYVLVRSYRPLQVYLYQDGFARFCNEKYSADVAERDNRYVHLTNVSVQKKKEDYNSNHGGKWSLANLKLYLRGKYGAEATRKLFDEMEDAILHSLKAVQNVMINDKHCFECYGYDMLIDENLKPWLIEVNASPALTATTSSDRSLKHSLVHNIFNVLLPQDLPCDPVERSRAMEELLAASNFITLSNETIAERLDSTEPRPKNWR